MGYLFLFFAVVVVVLSVPASCPAHARPGSLLSGSCRVCQHRGHCACLPRRCELRSGCPRPGCRRTAQVCARGAPRLANRKIVSPRKRKSVQHLAAGDHLQRGQSKCKSKKSGWKTAIAESNPKLPAKKEKPKAAREAHDGGSRAARAKQSGTMPQRGPEGGADGKPPSGPAA